jgi:hypothetical protein
MLTAVLDLVALDWVELDWVELDWVGWDLEELDSAALDLVALVELVRAQVPEMGHRCTIYSADCKRNIEC